MIENQKIAELEKNRRKFGATNQNDCLRCGICCQKGGPALHLADREKIESGHILLKYLFTIRAGEPAFNNVHGKIRTTDSDIIKIKAKAGSTACIFYNSKSSNCDIYDKRPMECRLLKCWDTRAIEANFNRNRLTRRDLMAGIAGLWELVMDHQERCSCARLAEKVASIRNGTMNAHEVDAILEMIHFDDSLRALIPTKSGVDKEILEFLLGRPMSSVVSMFGVRVDSNNSRLKFSLTPWASTLRYRAQIEKP